MSKGVTKTQALLTAVGFMVGSGIFFKADNIVQATEGNVFISILSWIFISTTLIFAGVSVSAVASQKNITGGFVGYIDYYFCKILGKKAGKTLGFIIGWYQIIVYIPIMIAIMSITFAGYFLQLIGIQEVGVSKYIIAITLVVAMFIWNGISTKIGALVSTSATIIKLIPLFALGVIGMIFGDFSNITHVASPELVSPNNPTSTLGLFFAPMLAIAFSFDGWVSVGSLSKDMENPEKDLPSIFIWSILITAAIYIFYFVGINLLMTGTEIVAIGDGHVGIIANEIGGVLFEKFILFGVVVSVLGTTNAVFMAGSRYTYKLASSNLLLGSKFFSKDSNTGTPFNASIFIFVVSLIYTALYYAQAVSGYTGIVIDDIPMALNSFFYIFIFYIAFYLYRKDKCNKFSGLLSPIIATIGQGVIVIAFFLTNDAAILYAIISAIVISLGFVNMFSKDNALKM